MSADIVIFDPDTILDRATFENPIQPADGIESVYVNGELIYKDSGWTGNRLGQVLKTAA